MPRRRWRKKKNPHRKGKPTMVKTIEEVKERLLAHLELLKKDLPIHKENLFQAAQSPVSRPDAVAAQRDNVIACINRINEVETILALLFVGDKPAKSEQPDNVVELKPSETPEA